MKFILFLSKYKYEITTLLILNAVDLILTYYGLSIGLQEANILFQRFINIPVVAIGAKIVGILISLFIISSCKIYNGLEKISLYFLILICFLVVLNNIILIMRV